MEITSKSHRIHLNTTWSQQVGLAFIFFLNPLTSIANWWDYCITSLASSSQSIVQGHINRQTFYHVYLKAVYSGPIPVVGACRAGKPNVKLPLPTGNFPSQRETSPPNGKLPHPTGNFPSQREMHFALNP